MYDIGKVNNTTLRKEKLIFFWTDPGPCSQRNSLIFIIFSRCCFVHGSGGDLPGQEGRDSHYVRREQSQGGGQNRGLSSGKWDIKGLYMHKCTTPSLPPPFPT